ncbi:cytochrome P450 [Sorangium sp. So ce118]
MDSTIQQGAFPDTLERLPAAELMSDPYGVLAKLRERSPAVPIESKGSRFWIITRYEDVRRVLCDSTIVRDLVKHRREINAHCTVRDDDRRAHIPKGAHSSLSYSDGESHHRFRRLATRFFSDENLQKLAEVTDKIVNEAVGSFRPGQQIDFIADYARPICERAFCQLAGIPYNEQNRQALLKVEAIMSSDKNKVERAAEALVAWATGILEIKRKEPGDDLFSGFLRIQEEIGMTHDELTSECIITAIGNAELLVDTAGSGAFLFLAHPDQLAKALAEPSLFDTGVDEIIRYESSFRFLPPRYTTAPIELDGVTIPAGELLLMCIGGANRDPNFIADADVFDITRATTDHVGFGHGVHKCSGAQIARNQTAAVLRTFFERFPATTLAEPADKARWRPGKFLRRLEALPVILA